MWEELVFKEDEYDLDGLLRMSELSMADFVFMIREDESEVYYIDRIEIQKYDVNFTKFIMRVKDYLESEETRGLFVLFAKGSEEAIQLFDGKNTGLKEVYTGEIELGEEVFYGMMIQYVDENYVFYEAIYTRESYAGDAHVTLVQNAGKLTEIMQKYIMQFN